MYERWKAGESVRELAEDSQRETVDIEEALRCEPPKPLEGWTLLCEESGELISKH